jgi:hypothetical protein
MKPLNSSSLVLVTAFAAMTEAGHGAQPPNVVVSDSHSNSAMGTGALVGITTGAGNTASGFIALQFNTTGLGNTASGMGALEFNTTGSLNTAVGNYALQGAAPSTGASGAPSTGGVGAILPLGPVRSLRIRPAPLTPPPGRERSVPTRPARITSRKAI